MPQFRQYATLKPLLANSGVATSRMSVCASQMRSLCLADDISHKFNLKIWVRKPLKVAAGTGRPPRLHNLFGNRLGIGYGVLERGALLKPITQQCQLGIKRAPGQFLKTH